jgi:hypothetical protein
MTAQSGGASPFHQAEQMTPHLSAEQVAAFVDKGLTPDERAQVEAHLAQCDPCRSEVVEVARLLHARARRRWLLLLPVAAAAGLLLVMHPFAPSSGRRPIERGGTPTSVGAVSTIAPSPDAVLPSPRPTFIWHHAASAASYHLTVTDEVGDVVWTGLTADTTIIIPARIRLEPERAYAWYVDVLLPDGSSNAGAVQRFRIGP